MSLDDRLGALRRKHEDLSREVEREQRSPSANPVTLADLKKRKLRVKEEIDRILRSESENEGTSRRES